jgi:hypothetical protein
MSSRIEKLFNEIVDEEKPRVDNVQMQSKKFNQNLLEVQKRIMEIAKRTCKEEFDWINQSGTITYDEKGVKVKIHENWNADADAKLGDFSLCLSRNDFGLKEFFDKVNLRFNSLHNENQTCLDSCVNYEQDKTDLEIKNCMKSCLINAYDNLNVIFSAVESKIAETIPKI